MDFMQEYDNDVVLAIVTCEQPYKYNRTIKCDFTDVVEEKNKALVKNHPGPQLWMEIQDGEGPNDSSLIGPVYPGQQLALVFHFGLDIFNFDSNIVHCWVTDGRTERQLGTTIDRNRGLNRPLLTQLQVIESGCSTRPKLFGNFLKYRDTIDGVKTTTQWVLFKAFRFPTTSRVLIQCDIQVCFKKCYPQPPCDPTLGSRKKRRSLKEHYETGLVLPEMSTMYQALEVLDPIDNDRPQVWSMNNPAQEFSASTSNKHNPSLGSPTTLRPPTRSSEESQTLSSTTKAPLLLAQTGGAVETEIDCRRELL